MKTYIFGGKKSGKTNLMRRLCNLPFASIKSGTDDMLFMGVEKHVIHDYNGLIRGFTPRVPSNISSIIYAIDLTDLSALPEVQLDLTSLRKNNPMTPIYLVGTKSDLVTKQTLIKIETLSEVVTQSFVTSAKTGEGISALRQALNPTAAKEITAAKATAIATTTTTTSNPSLLETAILTLRKTIASKDQKTKEAIEVEITKLQQAYHDHRLNQEFSKAVSDFQTNCQDILKDSSPVVSEAVTGVVMALIITAVTTGIVASFGLLLPPMFIIVAGISINLSIASMGVGALAGTAVAIGSGLQIYSLFNEERETAIQNVAAQATGPTI